jgi:dienelactone hydrolase
MRRDVEFVSDGDTVRGHLYLPDGASGPFPIVVMAGGWCYVKELVQPYYAQAFVAAGCAALVFDYRRLGSSEGTPRQHLDPWAQIEDYKNAISFAETLPEVDAKRVGVWGISYSGGHALIVGATDPRVRCVVSTIPVVDGRLNMERVHGSVGFRRLVDAVVAIRRRSW